MLQKPLRIVGYHRGRGKGGEGRAQEKGARVKGVSGCERCSHLWGPPCSHVNVRHRQTDRHRPKLVRCRRRQAGTISSWKRSLYVHEAPAFPECIPPSAHHSGTKARGTKLHAQISTSGQALKYSATQCACQTTSSLQTSLHTPGPVKGVWGKGVTLGAKQALLQAPWGMRLLMTLASATSTSMRSPPFMRSNRK